MRRRRTHFISNVVVNNRLTEEIMRQILHIKENEVIIYEVTDEYLHECKTSKESLPNKKEYLSYLKKTEFDSILLDRTKCIFSGKPITHYLTIKTDGDWLWSGDLEHYFEEHNFSWPKEHLRKIIDSSFELSEKSNSIFNKRIQLASELYENSLLNSGEDPFNDLIVQGRKIKQIKLTTTNPKLH